MDREPRIGDRVRLRMPELIHDSLRNTTVIGVITKVELDTYDNNYRVVYDDPGVEQLCTMEFGRPWNQFGGSRFTLVE